MFKSLRRIAQAMEERNDGYSLELRIAQHRNQLLLDIGKTLKAMLADMREQREQNEERAAAARGGAEEMICNLLEQLGERPTRITLNGEPAPQLARRKRTGLVVGRDETTAGELAE